MNAVQDRASVAPATVTKFSKGEVAASQRKRRGKPRILAVKDGLALRIDQRIMDVLHQQGVDFRCVEVVSATEVIVHNHPVR